MHADIPYMDPMGPCPGSFATRPYKGPDLDRYFDRGSIKKFQPSSFMDSGCLCLRGGSYTLQGIKSHLGKRKIIFKMPFLGGYVN